MGTPAKELNIAIVGGGEACKNFLDLLLGKSSSSQKVNVVGVADVDEDAPCIRYAKEKGIYTTKDYKKFYELRDLDLIFELTRDDAIRNEIVRTKPAKVELVCHTSAKLFWSFIEEMEQRIWLNKLNAICAAASSSLELENLLKVIASEVIRVLDVDSIGIYLIKGENLELAYAEGYSLEFYQRPIVTRSIGDGLLGKVAKEGLPMVFEDLTTSDTPYLEIALKEGLKSAAYIPLISKGKVLGVMRVSSHSSHVFSPQDVNHLIIIGNRIGEGINRCQLYHLSEEKYRFLFNANPNPIFIIDKDTLKILDANARAEEYYGYSRGELLEMSFADLECEKDKELISCLKSVSKGQLFLCYRRRCRKRSGELLYVDIYACLANYMGREVLIVVTADVTELVKKETHLIQAAKMSTLGQMASGIAHELNQPLSVIKAGSDFFLKMIKKGEKIEDEELRIIAEEVGAQVDRASEIINHLRSFARPSEVRKAKIDINAPIRDVFRMLGQQLRVHRIEVKLNLDESLPPIMADHNRLEQVFINLIINAMDAMEEKEEKEKKKIKKILSIRSYLEDGKIVVTVSDTGVGIPEGIMDRVFEPFFTTKQVGKGTGLGLSISYGIIKEYGGAIDIKSEEGVGTTFILKFPACLTQ